ncbi:MAG: hypothetical protein Q8M65_07050, partial [Rhodoglobus sp.]|nr:hypothetical protein [Rhodoglobus sp.]
MAPRVSLPGELGAAFTVARAVELGVGPRRLWGSDLERPFWGVRAAAGTLTDLPSLARAYSVRMPRHAFFSHATAARLWAIPLPPPLQSEIPLHVAVPHPRRAPESAGIAGHRLEIASADVSTVFGLPVTSIERTVLDLASLLDDEQLLGALDNILWRRRSAASRATRASIVARPCRSTGRRGKSRVIELLPLATDRSDSLPESVIRLRFIRA